MFKKRYVIGFIVFGALITAAIVTAVIWRRGADRRRSEAAATRATDRDTWYRAGTAAMASRQFPEAINSFRRAAAIAPNDASIHAQLADALTKNSQLAEGIEELKIADRLAGADPASVALLNFSSAYAARSDTEYTRAVQMFRTELTNHPDNSRVLAMLAGLQMRFGHIGEARATQELYLSRNPNDSDAWLVLEILCRRLADTPAANAAHARYLQLLTIQDDATELTRQVQMHPDDARVFLRLCMAMHRAGRNQEAFRALQRASKLEPENQMIAQMLQRIGKQLVNTRDYDSVIGAKPE